MNYVVVIVAEPGQLEPSSLNALQAKITGAQEPLWLSQNEACEISFVPHGPLDKTKRLELAAHFKTLLPQACDLAVLEHHNRKKKLIVTDMDATIIEEESLDELADEMGMKDHVAAITDRAMRGEIDFESALIERVALLQGLPMHALEAAMSRIKFSPGAECFIATCKKHGARTALVSGGFTLFTERVAALLQIDHHNANTLEFDNDQLKGTITLPLLDKAAKRTLLLHYCKTYNLQPDDALAIGDGSNDVDMIDEAGLGIGYRPKPLLVSCCDAHILVTRLETALFYQGYRRSEFAPS